MGGYLNWLFMPEYIKEQFRMVAQARAEAPRE